MDLQLEEYTGRGIPATASVPRVSLQRGGNVSINGTAYHRVGEPSHVVMLFDRTARVIGIRPATKGVPHAYVVRRQQRADSYVISPGTFFRYYGIPLDSIQTFNDPPIDDDGTILLRLDQAVTSERRGGKKKAS